MSGLLRLIALAAFVAAGLFLLRPDLLSPPDPEPATVPTVPKITLPKIELPDLSLPPLRRPSLPPVPKLASPVERILIEKAARRMTVWQTDGPPRVFTIGLGKSPVGTKTRQGDNRTPEGQFKIDRLNNGSAYHLSLGLNYPRPEDVARARREGVNPGGDIMIHGQPNQLASSYPGGSWKIAGDWTAGCVAITNDEIEELFARARIGTPVEIRP